MKILDKVEMIAKLKERIEEAKKQNAAMAEQLQKLLDNVLKTNSYKAI
jgi:nitrate reductase assembly molybdenum cofactor insertion protein NarJ